MERQPYPRWFWLFAIFTLLLASAPYFYGLVAKPDAHIYFGVHGNFDDHAVYSAWMKQAQEGRFLFENRFTVDEQPGLTVHIYFWAAGVVSKVTGIPLAMHLFRIVFGLFFLMALYRFVSSATKSETARGLAMALGVFGGGTGWMYWARYGNDGPIDLWQTEAFVFPSIMMHGLFCAALWLILVIWGAILEARESWRPVLIGALAVFVLTNIHTYDTMLVAIVAVGFLASQLGARTATPVWVARAGVIALGALPALAWFLYVRSQDPVFAARAATETFSPPMHDVLFGLGPLLLIGLLAVWMSGYRAEPEESPGRAIVAVSGAIFLLIGMALAQGAMAYNASALWLGPFAWILIVGAAAASCFILRPREPIYGLLFAWLLLGIVALYYPDVFQRKLAMGLALPMGVLSGLALAWFLERFPKPETRRALGAGAVLLLSLTSLRWIEREMQMARDNISKTTMHAVYYDQEVAAIADYLLSNAPPGTVVLAPPGIASRTEDGGFELLLPDLNPVLTGWYGMRTYAGHWSETPSYNERRNELSRLFFDGEDRINAQQVLAKSGADYVVLPIGAELPLEFELLDYERAYQGDLWELVRLGAPGFAGADD